MRDVQALTIELNEKKNMELVALYNEAAAKLGTTPVNRFSDHTKAVIRTRDILLMVDETERSKSGKEATTTVVETFQAPKESHGEITMGTRLPSTASGFRGPFVAETNDPSQPPFAVFFWDEERKDYFPSIFGDRDFCEASFIHDANARFAPDAIPMEADEFSYWISNLPEGQPTITLNISPEALEKTHTTSEPQTFEMEDGTKIEVVEYLPKDGSVAAPLLPATEPIEINDGDIKEPVATGGKKVKAPKEKKISKMYLIRQAFLAFGATGVSLKELAEYSGFDEKNARVAMYFLKNPKRTKPELMIDFMVRDGKFYTKSA